MPSAALRLVLVSCVAFGSQTSTFAQDSVYTPVSRSGSSQIGQGQPAAPAAAAPAAASPAQKELQTPGETKGMTTQEIMTRAKEKLTVEQFEAFEKAMKKIDPAQPEGVIDGTNIPPVIVFEKGETGEASLVGPPLPNAKDKEPRTPAAATAPAPEPEPAPVKTERAKPAPAPAPPPAVVPPSKSTAAAPTPPKTAPAPGSALGFPQPGHASD